MQQMATWKYSLFTCILGISMATVPARPQQPASASAPAPGADAKSYVAFGNANGAKGDLNAAIEAFNEAIRIDPKYAPGYYYRGLTLSQENKRGEALSDFNQAIQLDPTYAEAYYQRGCIMGENGDFDKALGDFSHVIKLDPKYSPAYYNSGHVHYFKGDLDLALDEINQALSLNPNFAVCYFIRGLVRHAQGHQAEALSDFQKSAGLNYPDAAFWVWMSEMESAQHGLARKDLSDALAKPQMFRPNDWPSQIANFLLEKITQDQLLDKARIGNDTELNDRMCEAWFYIGVSKHLAGDDKGAQDCFAKAIATGSKSSEEYIEAGREVAAAKAP